MEFLMIISFLIIVINCVFIWKLIVNFQKKPEALLRRPKDVFAVSVFSFFQFILSFFGVSDFAAGSIFYSKVKCLTVKKIPGTMNASAAVPVAVMALAFLAYIQMDSLTLAVAVAMQSIGAYFTPHLVAKTQTKTIKKFLAVSVIVATTKFFVSDFQISENTSMGLQGYKLLIFGLLCAFYGAFNNFGIGSFALTTLTAYIIGLNPLAALPIMTCAAAVSVPLASMKFIKLGMVSNSVSLLSTIAGTTGVWIAVFVIKSMDMSYIKYFFAAIFAVCAVAMLSSFWWKNEKYAIDSEEQHSKIHIVSLNMIIIVAILICLEFIFSASKVFTVLKESALIDKYASELTVLFFIFLLFISLLLISFSRLLHLEIYSHEESKIMILTDPLTGIANRRAFFERIRNEWSRLAREHKPLSLLMLDIDRFKKYNDAYGHPQGDELLKAFADVIRDAARRPADIATRLGGEEFGILLPDTSLENAVSVAENLRQKVEQMRVPMLNSRELTATTVSIGVATVIPSNDGSYKFLIDEADSMLYKAKHEGRNKICGLPRGLPLTADIFFAIF